MNSFLQARREKAKRASRRAIEPDPACVTEGVAATGTDFLGEVERRVKPIIVDPLTDPRWLALVEQSPTDVFHSPQWLRALSRTYGFEPRAVMIVDNEDLATAGMPYCVVGGLPGKRIASPPFSDYCDPIVSSADAWNSMLDLLLEEGCAITVRCLHNDLPVNSERMTIIDRAKWHGLDLTPDLDSLWAGLESSARGPVRQAESRGVVVRAATDLEELRAFFELHLRIRKYKYRLLAQPYAFFQHLWDEFVKQGRGSLMIALHDGRIVGGVFFLEWKDTLYYKFNASDAAFASVRPNDLIVWTAIETAKARGLTWLDFGLSNWDQEGLVRYKRKYASDEKTITVLHAGPTASPASTAMQIRELLPRLTELLTDDRVPDEVTERAGDLLYGMFA